MPQWNPNTNSYEETALERMQRERASAMQTDNSVADSRVAGERSRFEGKIGYSGLSGDERSFADSWLNSQDWRQWNAGWDEANVSKFKEALLERNNQQSIARAKQRYGELTDDNSEYNKNMYKRISRIYAPNSYENTMLYNAMGLSSKSSAFLGQKAFQQQERQAQDRTETAYMTAREQAEGRAQGYLSLGLQGEQSLLGIMSDTRLKEAQLRQQKEIEDNQRKSQLFSNILTSAVGIGAMFVPGGQVLGAGLLSKSIMDGPEEQYDYGQNYYG